MCLNGERVVFNGVNRHEWNAEKGRAIGPEDMYAAMEVFFTQQHQRRAHLPLSRPESCGTTCATATAST